MPCYKNRSFLQIGSTDRRKKKDMAGETKKGLGNRKRNRRWSSENESIRAEAAADWFTEGVKKNEKEELGAFEPGRVAACHEG